MPEKDSTHEQHCGSAPREFQAPAEQAPERLDKVLAQWMPAFSRRRLQGWIQDGYVLVNDQPARIRQPVRPGDRIVVHEQPDQMAQAFEPENIDLTVIAESPDWIVVDKPAGLVTHPGAGNWQGTLLNALLYHYPELRGVPRAGIVHRLDKDTSGVMVVARHERSHVDLVRQLQARTVDRQYQAVVHGTLVGKGEVDLPIGRDRRVAVRMTARQPLAPKPALTYYHGERKASLPDLGALSWVRCSLHTGRTHQIRVHMAALGHPLLGDTLYGGQLHPYASRQMLHARALAFTDAQTNKRQRFEATWPADFQQLQEHLCWAATG